MPFPFNSINIETSDGCNRKCSFCPNSLIDKPTEFMCLGMYTDILFQLMEGEYDGRVHLYQRGEPLMDDRLVDLTAMARRFLPKCHLYISTNGDYLTKELAEKLVVSGMNEIEVSHYDGLRLDLVKETAHLGGFVHHKDKKLNNPSGHWFNRAGLVDVHAHSTMKMDNNLCWWIFKKAGISCKGDYVLCCADWFPGKFGNIKDHTIMELWKGEELQKYRLAHASGMAKSMPMCDKCDTLSDDWIYPSASEG